MCGQNRIICKKKSDGVLRNFLSRTLTSLHVLFHPGGMITPNYRPEITFHLQDLLFSGHFLMTVCIFIFSCSLKGERNWHLSDSPAGSRVDTIKEPSDGSPGDQTSPRPTRHAAVFPGLSCGLKSFTDHVNKYPGLRILWFFTPEYKDAAAFVVAVQIQHGLLGWQHHVKSICTNKGRPIDINGAASSTECRKCTFEPVCAFE